MNLRILALVAVLAVALLATAISLSARAAGTLICCTPGAPE